MEMADSRDTLLPSSRSNTTTSAVTTIATTPPLQQHAGQTLNVLHNGPRHFEIIENNENLKRIRGMSVTPDSRDADDDDEDDSDLFRQLQFMRLNVGGKVFVTTRHTLERIPDTRLSHLSDLDINYNAMENEWFFDRNPDLFNCILDFYRCDELHFPHNVCGPSIKKELDYWKIQEGDISACCWNRYREWEEEKKIYDNIDQAFESKTMAEMAELTKRDDVALSTCTIMRRRIYVFLEEPMSSVYAQTWTLLFLLLVLTSIGILCIETHPALRVDRPKSEQYSFNTEVVTTSTESTYSNSTPNAGTIETVDSVPGKYSNNEKLKLLFNTDPHPALEYIDSFCTCFFTIEFLGRIVVAPDRIKFLKSVMNIIDVLCVLPMWIKYILQIYHVRIGLDLLPVFFLIMMLRVLRICRVLRLARHYTGVKILLLALRASVRELLMLLIFIFIVMLIFSVVIYYAEFFQIDTFANIPEGFWWVIITLTTVGYGDMYPKSFSGYLVGSLCALTGILATGLPVPIIANNFNLYYSHAALKENIENRKVAEKSEIADTSASKISINLKMPRFSKRSRRQSKDNTSSV